MNSIHSRKPSGGSVLTLLAVPLGLGGVGGLRYVDRTYPIRPQTGSSSRKP